MRNCGTGLLACVDRGTPITRFLPVAARKNPLNRAVTGGSGYRPARSNAATAQVSKPLRLKLRKNKKQHRQECGIVAQAFLPVLIVEPPLHGFSRSRPGKIRSTEP